METNGNGSKKYFKCNFCKIFNKKVFGICNMMSFKKGKLCYYNTIGSIWKWCVRFSVTILPIVILWWYITMGFKHFAYYTINRSALNGWQVLSAVAAGTITVALSLGIIIRAIALIIKIHDEFVDKFHGSYFGKERRRYNINEIDRSE